MFLETASRFPDQLAVVSRHQGVRLTWRELEAAGPRVQEGYGGSGWLPRSGAALVDELRGVGRDSVWMRACRRRAGEREPGVSFDELSFVLRKSRMKALFLQEQDRRANYREILAESRVGDQELHDVIYLGSSPWQQFLSDPARSGRRHRPRRAR